MKKITEAGQAKRRENYPDDPEEPRYNDPAIQQMYTEMVNMIDQDQQESCAAARIECVSDQLDVPPLEVMSNDSLHELPEDHTSRPPVRSFKAMFCDGTKQVEESKMVELAD